MPTLAGDEGWVRDWVQSAKYPKCKQTTMTAALWRQRSAKRREMSNHCGETTMTTNCRTGREQRTERPASLYCLVMKNGSRSSGSCKRLPKAANYE